MKREDIVYCGDLLKRAGLSLMDTFENQQPETDVMVLMHKFSMISASVGDMIRPGLAAHFPDISWSEDEFNITAQHAGLKGEYWVCDPIDGGIHFMQGFAPWCITLALMENGKAKFSMIYEPVRQELFYALENGGAFLNDRKISVSAKDNFAYALIGTAHPNKMVEEAGDTADFIRTVTKLSGHIFGIRMLGPASLQLAYVACGRLDGYVEHGDDIYDWLAGALLVTEAGGVVNATDGSDFGLSTRGIIAANPILRQELLFKGV